MAHIIPLSLKDSELFSSFGVFTDRFTFNIVFAIFSIIALYISVKRNKVSCEENIELHRNLAHERQERIKIISDRTE